jgi:hypothetical protein
MAITEKICVQHDFKGHCPILDFFLGQEDDILVAAAARRPVRSFREFFFRISPKIDGYFIC